MPIGLRDFLKTGIVAFFIISAQHHPDMRKTCQHCQRQKKTGVLNRAGRGDRQMMDI